MTLIELDSRKRAALGSIATTDRYLVEIDRDGIITLTPAAVMSEMEARLLARPDILEIVERSRSTGADAGRPVRRPA